MKLLLVAAASLAVVSCASLSMEDQEFHAWKLKFGKVYRSPEEEARRKDIWLSTRRTVLAHNILADQGIKTYRMGMNHLSDMDKHDHMTLMPEDLNSTSECAVISPRPLDGAVLPTSVDWRTKGCVTPVKKQLTCHSCWAFSSVGALESHTCIKHKLKRPIPLSEQQLVDCSRSEGNDGCRWGFSWKSFLYCMHNKGIVTADFYPYKAQVFQCPFTKSNPIPDDKIGAKCSGCRQCVQGDEQSLQRAVAEIGPVVITIPMHPSFYNYENGVYYESNCKAPPPNNAYHLMLVVGYGASKDGDYWLVKNSWGESWGERGYIKMARNRNNHCGIATWGFYPVVK